jgi:hypothetical protein
MLGCQLPFSPYREYKVKLNPCYHSRDKKDKFCPECGKELYETRYDCLFDDCKATWGKFVVNHSPGYNEDDRYYVGKEVARVGTYADTEKQFTSPSMEEIEKTKRDLKKLLEPHDMFEEELFGMWLVWYTS